MAQEFEYRVTIEVEVTATSPGEAMRFALNDLRDTSLEGPWYADVQNLDTGEVKRDVASTD